VDALLDVWIVEEFNKKHIKERIDLDQEVWMVESSVSRVAKGLVEVKAQL